MDVHVGDFGNVVKSVKLTQDKDFIAGCGMPMVWIADGGYWAAKYPFRQSDFEKVAGYNPSYFRGPNLPVETISWESAQVFIEKLNKYEGRRRQAPRRLSLFAARANRSGSRSTPDADIGTAAISSNGPLASTQNVGYSAPQQIWHLRHDRQRVGVVPGRL